MAGIRDTRADRVFEMCIRDRLHGLAKDQCFVLVNAKAFFSAAELEKLYKMARYRKLCLLLLEPRAGTTLPGEEIRLFDEDLCELTLDSGP